MYKSKITATPLIVLRIILLVLTTILILILPQINIQEYVSSTITSRLIYFLYSSLMLLLLFTFFILFSKKVTFRFSKIDIALFILILYITVNRYFIQSCYGFSIRYIELLGLSFLYIILRHISFKNYPWLLLSVVISGIVQATYGYLQLFGYYHSNHSGFKMTGSFFNPGPYAGFLASVWAVAFGLYLFKDSIIIQMQSQKKNNFLFLNAVVKYIFEYIPLLGLVSIAIVLPALQSRASWIATIAASGILLELKYRFLQGLLKKGTARFKKIIIIFLSIIILSAGLFSLYDYKKFSSDGRVFIWKVTTEMIVDNPIFGVGFDRFNAYYMNYQAEYFQKNGETLEATVADNTYYAFNDWLQFVSENGTLGLILFLAVVFILFQAKVSEKYQSETFIGKTGLITISIFACFSYPMQILPIKLILVILLVILSNGTADPFKLKILVPSSSPHERFGTGIVKRRGTLGIIFILYKSTIVLLACFGMHKTISCTKSLSQGFITWNNALNSYQYGDYKGAILDFELAYSIFKKDGDFLRNYGKTLTMANDPNKAIALLKQAQFYQNNTIIAIALGDNYKTIKQYNKAESNYKQAINMAPGKFYGRYLLVKLYDVSGQNVKAVSEAEKILKKSIKVPSTAIDEIKDDIKKILLKYKRPSVDVKINKI